jgi:hypothetical protein
MILGDVPSLHELNVLIFDLANDYLDRFAEELEHCTYLQRIRLRQTCFHLAAKAIHNNEKLRQGHARQNLNELKFELAKFKSLNKSVNLCNSEIPDLASIPTPEPEPELSPEERLEQDFVKQLTAYCERPAIYDLEDPRMLALTNTGALNPDLLKAYEDPEPEEPLAWVCNACQLGDPDDPDNTNHPCQKCPPQCKQEGHYRRFGKRHIGGLCLLYLHERSHFSKEERQHNRDYRRGAHGVLDIVGTRLARISNTDASRPPLHPHFQLFIDQLDANYSPS